MPKFVVKGRVLESYQLSNEELVDLIENGDLDDEQKKVLQSDLLGRFKHNNCRREGETSDELFARQFGKFVNGKLENHKKVAEKMAKEHRYLQQEMFKVCLAYINVLAENHKKGWYDPRNEWAGKMSSLIVDWFDKNLSD